MSLLRNLNSPPLVALAGGALAVGFPALQGALSAGASLALLKSLNLAAFAANCVAVSIPGRLDGPQDDEMRKGSLNPTKPNADSAGEGKDDGYSLNRSRTLVNPSGWAFAIWGPIYLGEAAFVAAQFVASDATASALLPSLTAPFVAANIFQSLWCASFRPSYGEGWRKYVSAAMLGATAASLSVVHSAGAAAVATDPSTLGYLLLPMTMHFGWTTAATLVNLNGSLAADESASPRSLIAMGNSSALAATALGVGLTIARSDPAYGLTLAWALAACADGMSKRIPSQNATEEETLKKATAVQGKLCWAGSIGCAVAAAYAALL
ncbi:hypothetical protein ACHAXT_001202 [Thalassiosira profunda]